MKKISLIAVLILSFSIFSCTSVVGNQEGEKDNIEASANESSISSDDTQIEYLTYETFIEKVWNFEKNPQEWVYEGDVPCVIDFYADWCRPCRMVAPIMDELSVDYKGKVKIYKIDVDKEKQLAAIFQVRSIPAVLFSPMEGRPIMQAGALPKDQYVKIIEENLLTSNEPK